YVARRTFAPGTSRSIVERVHAMSGLVVAAIMPHGHMAVPEALSPEEADLGHETQQAMAEIGRRFAEAQPEVIILLTPHNINVEGHMAVILAGKVAGSLS